MRSRRAEALLVLAALLAAGACDSAKDAGDEDGGGSSQRRSRPAVEATRTGSTVVAGDAPPLVVAGEPATYRIVYRLDDHAAGGHVVSTDELRVDRPFRGWLATYKGAPDERGELIGGQVTILTRLSVPAIGGRPPVTVVTPPEIAGNDLRFGAVLEWAAERGYIHRRERRLVVGRQCTVYRSGDPVTAGLLVPVAEGPDGEQNYADACVDDRGLLLEEVWVTDGLLLRRKLAVSVEEGLTFVPEDFPISDRLMTEAEGAATARAIDPATRPEGPFWVLDVPPPGFAAQQRFVVVLPDDSTERGDAPPNRGRTLASLVDVYVRGVDVLIIEQGGTIGSVQRRPVPSAVPKVTAGALGEVGIIPGFRTMEVRAALTNGRFVRVVGTILPDELVAVASSLRLEPEGGTGVRYLGD